MRHQQLEPVLSPSGKLYCGYADPHVPFVELHVVTPDTVPYGNVTVHVPSVSLYV